MFKPRVWVYTERYEPDNEGNFYLAQSTEPTGNTLISPGRAYAGLLLTGLASGGFLWVAAGSTTVAVDSSLDDRLGGYSGSATPAFEYIANVTRKKLQSTLYGGDLTDADWVAENYTDGLGNVYRYKCAAQVTYGPSDANGTVDGVPLQRYGLCLHSPCPDTVTGYSGIMLNEMIDATAQTLTTSNQVIVKFILRI